MEQSRNKNILTIIIVFVIQLVLNGGIALYNYHAGLDMDGILPTVLWFFIAPWLLLIPTILFMRRDKEKVERHMVYQRKDRITDIDWCYFRNWRNAYS